MQQRREQDLFRLREPAKIVTEDDASPRLIRQIRTTAMHHQIPAKGRQRPAGASAPVEALTLSIAGGIVGVTAELGIAQQLASRFSWPLLIRPQIIFIAVGFSGGVGIAFGLFPARKASRLDPIEALRFE